MRPNIYLHHSKPHYLPFLLTVLAFASASFPANAQAFSEGFETLPAWAQQNLSSPLGVSTWVTGSTSLSPAQNGTADSYIVCNFNSATGAGTISNWLFTPVTTLSNGDVFSFWTRTVNPATFPDRMQVRMSINGASVNVGTTETSVGDFTTLLFDINPALTATGYPSTWTQFTATISGLGAPASGRFAFRYFVTNGGPSGSNSDIIGVDNVVYTPVVLPVTLTNFSGHNDGNRNQLTWTTSSERDNSGFEIQRSTDGVNYTTLDFVKSLATGGNITTRLNYTFTDNSVVNSNQYYRLRQVDFNGESKISNVVLIKSEKTRTLTLDGLYPNPATTVVNALISAPNEDKVTIVVTDITGKAIFQQIANVEIGSTTLPIDVSSLAAGTYWMKLVCNSNCESAMSRFVKQ